MRREGDKYRSPATRWPTTGSSVMEALPTSHLEIPSQDSNLRARDILSNVRESECTAVLHIALLTAGGESMSTYNTTYDTVTELWDRIPDDIQWGIIWWAGCALFFSGIAVVLWWFMSVVTGGGVTPMAEVDLEEAGGMRFRFWKALVAYWLGGLPTGLLVGWLRRFAAKSWLRGAAVGAVASIPFVGVTLALLIPPSRWGWDFLVLWALYSFVAAPIAALVFRATHKGDLRKDEDGRWNI